MARRQYLLSGRDVLTDRAHIIACSGPLGLTSIWSGSRRSLSLQGSFVSSTGTTASAPSGMGAPVMIRAAVSWPYNNIRNTFQRRYLPPPAARQDYSLSLVVYLGSERHTHPWKNLQMEAGCRSQRRVQKARAPAHFPTLHSLKAGLPSYPAPRPAPLQP